MSNVSNGTIQNIKLHRNIDSNIAYKLCEDIGVDITILFDEVIKTIGLSEPTILHHHRLISSILTSAVQWQFILSNPASSVKPPKVEKKDSCEKQG
jgi:integrase